mmetsp:Transcript_17589/g.41299  ORF Transcript_17589/g.41299 Transcript_17589/m.41299 type:complete len:280 (-) Transcript_17589:709-1548(-)
MSFRNDAMFDSTRSIVAKSLASVALRCSSRLSAVSSSDSATPNGLSILALTRSSFDKISVIKASRASNRDDSQCRDPAPTDGSPGEANFARSASRADTGKTIGVPRGPPPIMAVPLSRTKTVTSCTAFSSGRLSILLTTKTTFLPHPLISSKKFFSLSLKGRSEEVTNKTKSALGTIRRVSCSCAEITAFVPGVSTTARSDSHGTYSTTTNAIIEDDSDWRTGAGGAVASNWRWRSKLSGCKGNMCVVWSWYDCGAGAVPAASSLAHLRPRHRKRRRVS